MILPVPNNLWKFIYRYSPPEENFSWNLLSAKNYKHELFSSYRSMTFALNPFKGDSVISCIFLYFLSILFFWPYILLNTYSKHVILAFIVYSVYFTFLAVLTSLHLPVYLQNALLNIRIFVLVLLLFSGQSIVAVQRPSRRLHRWDVFFPLNGTEDGSAPSLTTRDRELVSVLEVRIESGIEPGTSDSAVRLCTHSTTDS